jgi:hypothetical protein
MEMRDDDAFWAAQRVMAFSDDLIRAVVRTGEYSDPAAAAHLVNVLIKRRDAIGRTYLPAINPVVDPKLDASGTLTFGNAAVSGGFAAAPVRYLAVWSRFDNSTGEKQRIAETQSETTSMTAPPGLPGSAGSYVAVDISAESADHPSWREPIHVYFRRAAAGWTLVGLERLSEQLDRDENPRR